MNKIEINEVLRYYNLNNNKYIVLSGAAMVLQEVKEYTDDIDIAVSKEYYKFLLKKYNCTFDCINIFNNKVYFIDNIINFSFDYFDSEYTIINGVKVQTLNSIKQLKENLGRNKDKKDIKLINKRFKKNI